MPDFTFLNATQDDKGKPAQRVGWLQEVNANSAAYGHARRRKFVTSGKHAGKLDQSRRMTQSRAPYIKLESKDHTDVAENAGVPESAINPGSRSPSKETTWLSKPTQPQVSFLRQITGSLDPFLSLPMECTETEKSLLAYYLLEGRRSIVGTCPYPKYDGSLDVVGKQLQWNSVWSWTHIVTVEEKLSRAVGRPKTASFHRRRADAYADAKRILFDDSVPLTGKLATLFMLQVMETCVGDWNLQAMHSDAIDEILAANGGLSLFLREKNCMVQPIWFMIQWRAGILKGLPWNVFEESSACLYKIFLRIRRWTTSITSHNPSDEEKAYNRIALSRLIKYLTELVSVHLRLEDDGDFVDGLSSLFLLLNLCGTFVLLGCTFLMASNILLTFQSYMEGSYVSTDGSFPDATKIGAMHLNSVVALLSHIRREAQIPGVPRFTMKQEIDICEVSMHAAKVLPMFSAASRLRIGRCMLKCALVVTQDTSAELFDEVELEDLKVELDQKWYRIMNNTESCG